MPLRSVVEIDVADQGFDRFFDKWKAYDQQKREAAEEDRERAKEEKARREDEAKAEEERKRTSVAGRIKALSESVPRGLKAASTEWEKMQNASRNVARSMEQIGSRALHLVGSMTKLTGLLSLVGGAATGFGFLGADVLARTASGWRRNAMGLGATIGGSRAFGLNFGRFVDPNSMLSGVSQAMRDPRNSVALNALGVRAQPGEDTALVAARALERVQELAKRQPENTLGTLLTSYKLDQLGLNLQDLQRLRAADRGEVGDQARHFRQDRGALDLNPAQARGWQDFLTTLDRARMGIETTFIVRLSPLAPALGHLSEAFNKVVSKLLERQDFGKWIEQAADGLEHLAHYISGDDFQKDVEKFGTKIGEMATAIGRFVTWLVGTLEDLHIGDADPKQGTPGVDPKGTSIPHSGPMFGSNLWQNPDGTIVDPDTGRFYTRRPDGNFDPTDKYAPGSSGDKRFVQPPEPEQPAVPYKAGDIIRDMNITEPQYDAFKGSVASIEHARYDQMGGAGKQHAGRYQFGRREIEETAARLGEPAPTTQQFLNDPARQERFFEAYTAGHNAYLLANSAEYRALSPEKRLAILGYAHNQGPKGAADYLRTGQEGRDLFGTSGKRYSNLVTAALVERIPTRDQRIAEIAKRMATDASQAGDPGRPARQSTDAGRATSDQQAANPAIAPPVPPITIPIAPPASSRPITPAPMVYNPGLDRMVGAHSRLDRALVPQPAARPIGADNDRRPARDQRITDIAQRMAVEPARPARGPADPQAPPRASPTDQRITEIAKRMATEVAPDRPADTASQAARIVNPQMPARPAGADKVHQDIVQFGKAWKDRIADATRPFVDHLGQMMQAARQPTGTAPPLSTPRAPRVDIHIHNETGGNAVMSAAQASAS
jgi:hypothetical protein